MSGLTLSSLIHFELILFMVLKSDVISFFECSCSVFPADLLKRLSSHHRIFLPPLS